MPPKKKDVTKKAPKKAAPKGKTGPRGMSKPMLPGVIMTDLVKKQWQLGPVIGQGGFGYIYLGNIAGNAAVTNENANYVIKVEPHVSGPLFGEIAFYQRVAKADMVNAWMQSKKKNHIGIPLYIGTGSFDYEGTKYRFIIMDRCSTDVEKIYKEFNYKFPEKTVFSLGLRILDVLEYIHDHEYVHADIKSSNLMMGYKKSNQVYLLDYGLAYRYCPNGKHVPYKEDPKRRHDGTIEYTSRDAHKGCAPSRKGDLEILAYCMTQWLCGRLPWENNLTDKEYVMKEKIKYMDNISSFMNVCFTDGQFPGQLQDYVTLVAKMRYEERPDYEKMKKLFSSALKTCGVSDDGVSVSLPSSSITAGKQKSGKRRTKSIPDDSTSPRKRICTSASSPSPSKNSPRKAPKATGARSTKKAILSPAKNSPKKAKGAKSIKNSTIISPAKRSVVKVVKSPETSGKPTSGRGTKRTIKTEKIVMLNGKERIVHMRLRKKNVKMVDFAQSP